VGIVRPTQSELVKDAGHMPLDGGHRDHELVRYARVRAALCDELEYLAFPGGKDAEGTRRPPATARTRD
jgi:hypothetical protein